MTLTTLANPFRPPRVSGGLPVVGHAIAFGKNPDRFIARAQAEYGNTFDVALPGGRRIFLTNPHDFPRFYAETRMTFLALATELGGRMAGYDWQNACLDDMHVMTHGIWDWLKGPPLQFTSGAMQDRFLALFRESSDESGSRNLLAWCERLLLDASSRALFGFEFPVEQMTAAYQRIDRQVPLLAAGMPAGLMPGCRAAQDQLANAVADWQPDCSPLMEFRHNYFEKRQIPRSENGYMDASLLWASLSNTTVTVFWLLWYLARDPRAIERVRAELDTVRAASRVGDPFAPEQLKQMRLLDAAVNETLRLASAPMSIRVCDEDFQLELDDGRTLDLRTGNNVCLYIRGLHLDPEIHDDPNQFRIDRFLAEAGNPRRFYKDGRRVKFALLPFGSGESKCPGRAFARNEAKVMAAHILERFDLTLDRPDHPGFDWNRVGLGVLAPSRPVNVQLEPRT